MPTKNTWIIYTDGSSDNLKIGRKNRIWGADSPKKFTTPAHLGSTEIKCNDFVLFVKGISATTGGNPHGFRVDNVTKFLSFGPKTEAALAIRVTSDIYIDNSEIWPITKGEIYPYRFTFEEIYTLPGFDVATLLTESVADALRFSLIAPGRIYSIDYNELVNLNPVAFEQWQRSGH